MVQPNPTTPFRVLRAFHSSPDFFPSVPSVSSVVPFYFRVFRVFRSCPLLPLIRLRGSTQTRRACTLTGARPTMPSVRHGRGPSRQRFRLFRVFRSSPVFFSVSSVVPFLFRKVPSHCPAFVPLRRSSPELQKAPCTTGDSFAYFASFVVPPSSSPCPPCPLWFNFLFRVFRLFRSRPILVPLRGEILLGMPTPVQASICACQLPYRR